MDRRSWLVVPVASLPRRSRQARTGGSRLTNAQGRGATASTFAIHHIRSRSCFLSNAPNAQLRARPMERRREAAQSITAIVSCSGTLDSRVGYFIVQCGLVDGAVQPTHALNKRGQQHHE